LVRNNSRRFIATFSLAVSLAIAALVPQAQAAFAAYQLMWYGEVVLIAYSDSPLRSCPSQGCTVIANMPASRGSGPGQGWATSLQNQNWYGAWCLINWRNITGYTGCWRLAPARN
jgi:hypothetical protein